jgi:hypothetical protein
MENEDKLPEGVTAVRTADSLTIFMCFKRCEHVWDGEPWEGDGVWTTTCSKCGAHAIDVSMREGP